MPTVYIPERRRMGSYGRQWRKAELWRFASACTRTINTVWVISHIKLLESFLADRTKEQPHMWHEVNTQPRNAGLHARLNTSNFGMQCANWKLMRKWWPGMTYRENPFELPLCIFCGEVILLFWHNKMFTATSSIDHAAGHLHYVNTW